jgi:Na+/H+ antiporter NhaD/arsenite permease-like protein
VRIQAVATSLLLGKPDSPVWAVIAFWATMAYFFWSSAKRVERRRREQGRPHTRRDTALLALSGLILAALVLGGVFLKPLNMPFLKVIFGVIVVAAAAGLVSIFNRTGSRGSS